MYQVNDAKFDSYFQAIAAAKASNVNVIESATGTIRWEAPKPVSKKKIKQYNERKAAYDAQQKYKA